MPVTPWVPLIRRITDVTDSVSASVMNPIIDGFINRTQYLYEKFSEVNDKSVLIAFDQPVREGTDVAKYSVVFFNAKSTSTGLDLARPLLEQAESVSLFKAADNAFAFGIEKDDVPPSGEKLVDVYMQGLIELPGTGFVNTMLESSEVDVFTSGPLFLSSTQPGKLTSNPGGLAIYIGFAKSLDELYLNPSYEGVNSLFFNFRYTLLDRPAGAPLGPTDSGTPENPLDDTWAVTSTDITKVGWIPANSASLVGKVPTDYAGSLFFYNIPTDAEIDADTGLSDKEKLDAKSLRRSLPPQPTAFSFLTVNGIVQGSRVDDETDGIYLINHYGIWWYDNKAGRQPWANDILTGHGGVWVPSDWASWKGSSYLRPKMVLQFIKLNPDYKLALVTSIKPLKDATNDSSKAIKFVSIDDHDVEQSTGDILAKFKLPITETTEVVASGTSVKNVTYDEPNGTALVTKGKVVSSILGLGQAKVFSNLSTGEYTVSVNSEALSNIVTTMEVEQARLEFKGLHSYLNLDYNQSPSGFVGKFMLPEIVPALPLRFKVMLFGLSGIADPADIACKLRFKFEYAITSPSTVVSTATLPIANKIFDVTLAKPYTANTCLLISPAELTIPTLVNNGIVNFRLHRVKPEIEADQYYKGHIGIVATYWSIESQPN